MALAVAAVEVVIWHIKISQLQRTKLSQLQLEKAVAVLFRQEMVELEG